MIRCTCARCGREHFSDEMHAGFMLRCAGCGDPVSIGVASSRSAIGPVVIDGEVVQSRAMRSKEILHSTSVLRKVPTYAYVGGLLVVIFIFFAWQIQSMIKDAEKKPLVSKPLLRQDRGPSIASQPSAKVFLVPIDTHPPAEHQTGDAVLRSSKGTLGRGQLTLENGNEGDAVISLISEATGKRVRSIYIREGDKGAIRSLGPGSYWVKIAKGWGWDDFARRFTVEPSYFKVPHPYEFTETYEDDRVRYSTVTLTLYKVPGGNVSQESISQDDFDAEN